MFISKRFVIKVIYSGIFGNVKEVVLSIMRNIVLGVIRDVLNKKVW